MKGCGVATIITPQDKHNDINIFYWDIYDSMENVMNYMAIEAAVSDIPNEMSSKFLNNLPDGFNHRNIAEFYYWHKTKRVIY